MKKFTFILLAVLAGAFVFAQAATTADQKTWLEVLQYAVAIAPAIAAALIRGVKHWPELIRSKTFWTGVSAILAALQQFQAGNIDAPTFVFAVLAGLALIFIRDAQAGAEAAARAATGPDRR